MLEQLQSLCLRGWEKLKGWWGGLSSQAQAWTAVGAAAVGASLMIGGIVAQAVVAGAASQVMLWQELKESPTFMRFMKKHGKWIDYGLTGAALITGVTGGITAMMYLAATNAFFTLCRYVHCSDDAVEPKKITIDDGQLMLPLGATV